MEKEKLEQKLTFDDQVIEKIAGITANQVPGIISLDGNMFSEFTDKLTQGTDKAKGIEVYDSPKYYTYVKSKWRSKWMPRSNTVKVQRRSLKRSQAESKKPYAR